MLVRCLGELDYLDPVELVVDDIRQLLAGVKHVYGQEIADKLYSNEHKYILANSKDENDVVALHPGLVTMNFAHYDRLFILPSIEGDVPAAIFLAIGFSAFWAGVASFVATVALSIALSAIMQLLSPTPSFSTDPSSAQTANKLNSNLFNGAPNIREQGGSVPLVYGYPMMGGVLISAGISTEEATL